MKKMLLSLLILASSPFAFAANDAALDDLTSPAEIGAEVRQQNPSFVEKAQGIDWLFTPAVKVVINKAARGPTAQTMWVYVKGSHLYTWKVSTGRERQEHPPSGRDYFSSTPTGTWEPYGTSYLHHSRTWDADMPFSIWLTGGIAIHAALPKYEQFLGKRASGGCIRLSHRNASTLYNLVESYGISNTRVTIYNK